MNDERNRARFYAALPFFLYGLLIAAFLGLSWMKWGDLIVDTGKWYVPERLLSGEVLYRDKVWFYGPLVPYLNALFFRIGGVQIGSLAASGVLSLVLTVYALHSLAKAALGLLPAVLVVVTFLTVFAFGYYVTPCNYNFIIPYSYDTTYGLAFALLGLHFYQKQKEAPGKIPEILSVIFLCATLLTRVEIGLMALAAIGLPALLELRTDKSRGWSKARLALTVVWGSVGTAVLFFLLFFGSALYGEPGVWNTVIGYISHRGPYEANISGMNNTGDNLKVWLISGCLYALFTLLFAGGGYFASRIQGPPGSLKTRLSILAVGLATLVLAYYLFSAYFGYQAQYRCLPLLCLVVGAQAARNLLQGRNPERESLVLTLCLFSFLMLLRVFFRVWPGHYGFTLLVPGLIVYYLFPPDASIPLFPRPGESVRQGRFRLPESPVYI